jgi:hypothetical protein
LLEVFSSISFNEILIEEPARDLPEVFEQIVTTLKVLKLNFSFSLSLRIISKFINYLHTRLLPLNIIICFEMAENNEKEVILFA